MSVRAVAMPVWRAGQGRHPELSEAPAQQFRQINKQKCANLPDIAWLARCWASAVCWVMASSRSAAECQHQFPRSPSRPCYLFVGMQAFQQGAEVGGTTWCWGLQCPEFLVLLRGMPPQLHPASLNTPQQLHHGSNAPDDPRCRRRRGGQSSTAARAGGQPCCCCWQPKLLAHPAP